MELAVIFSIILFVSNVRLESAQAFCKKIIDEID